MGEVENKSDRQRKSDGKNNLYEKWKVESFPSQHELTGLERSERARRVNVRLETMINRAASEGRALTDEDVESYVEKQCRRMDRPPAQNRRGRKAKGEGIFATSWGEEIYRGNAFLGAEINGMESHSSFNRKLREWIRRREKLNRRPTEDQAERAMQRLMATMSKRGVNDYALLNRLSTERILTALLESGEATSFPHHDEEAGDGAIIYLRVALASLSWKETRAIRAALSCNTEEVGGDMLVEAGFVASPCGSRNVMYAEAVALKRIAELLMADEEALPREDGEAEVIAQCMTRIEGQTDAALKALADHLGEPLGEGVDVAQVKRRIAVVKVCIALCAVGVFTVLGYRLFM